MLEKLVGSSKSLATGGTNVLLKVIVNFTKVTP
jgi:hypothetical protein